MNGLGYGYRLFEFCQGAKRCLEAAVEKPAINRQKSMVFAVLAQVSDGMANVQTPVSQF